MGGALILPTWILDLDQLELSANGQTRKVSENCKYNTFYETFGKNY